MHRACDRFQSMAGEPVPLPVNGSTSRMFSWRCEISAGLEESGLISRFYTPIPRARTKISAAWVGIEALRAVLICFDLDVA